MSTTEITTLPPTDLETMPTRTDLAIFFTEPGGIDAILARIAKEARSKAAGLDISRESDRKKIASLARTSVAGSKVALIEAGKKLTEAWRVQTDAVNADCNKVKAFLDALRDEIRKPLTDFENAEKLAKEADENEIARIEGLPNLLVGDLTSAQVQSLLDQVPDPEARAWRHEFKGRACAAVVMAKEKLQAACAAAVKREADAAELAALRAAQAEAQRVSALKGAIDALAAHAFLNSDNPTAADFRRQIDRLDALWNDGRDWQDFSLEAEAHYKCTLYDLNWRMAAAIMAEDEARKQRDAEIAAKAKQDAEAEAEKKRLAAEAQAKADLEAAERREQEAKAAAEKADADRKAMARRVEERRVTDHGTAIREVAAMLEEALSDYNTAATVRRAIDKFEASPQVHRDYEEFSGEAASLISKARDQMTARLAEVEAAEEAKRLKAQKAEYHRSMLRAVKDCAMGFIGGKPYPYGILERELTAKITFDEDNFGDLLAGAIEIRDEALVRLKAAHEAAILREQEKANLAAQSPPGAVLQSAYQSPHPAIPESAANVTPSMERRRTVNKEIVADLVKAGVSETAAVAAVRAIAQGKIRHTTINY